jgi:predicted phage terminase large subunit-like protein
MGSPHLADGLVLQRKWIKYYDKALSQNVMDRDPEIPALPNKIPSFILQGRGPSESLTGPEESETKNNSIHKIRTVVSVDSAEKETVRADYTAIQVWCYASDRKHYLLDVIREKMEFPKLVDQVERAARKWNADLILCETKGAGNQYVQSRAGAEDRPCGIIGYNPGRDDKTIRFEGTMTQWQAGEVLLPERAPWLQTYIDELLRFPNGKNDDNVDATSQYLNWHRAGGSARRGTKKLSGTA